MCGIVAILNNISNLNGKHFLDLISHRGGDNKNYINQDSFFLGHSLLKTSDKDTARSTQPMISKYTGNCIIFNGEIFNHLQLRKNFLEKKNINFQSNTDTETILYLYDYYGLEIFSKLNGDFSIIIFDKNKKEFIIARDRFGLKPLYFSRNNQTVFFSSEIKAIKSFITNHKFTLNKSIAEKFIFENSMPLKNITFFNDIFPIQASHVYKFDIKGNEIYCKNFWESTLKKNLNINSLNYKNLNDKIKEAVSIRTNCIFDNYALFLSGGLDSSALLHFLSQNTDKQITTYSLIEEENYKENENIDYFINKYSSKNTKSIKVLDSDLNQSDLFDEMLTISDTPIPDFSFLASLYFTKLSKDNGQKVIFKGDCGDETFCGHQKHIYAYLSRYISSFNMNSFFNNLKKFNGYNNNSSKHYFFASIYEALNTRLKNNIKKLVSTKPRIFNGNYSKLNFYENLHEDSFNNVCLNFIYNWIIPYVSDIEDKVCSKYNMVLRSPFSDYELIDYVFKNKLDNIFEIGTKSLLKLNPDLSYPDKIIYDNEKRSYPAGFKKFMFNNSKKIDEYVFDKYSDFDFINKNFLSVYKKSKSKNDSSKCFRMYSLLRWAEYNYIS